MARRGNRSMLDCDERDLPRLAEAAGLAENSLGYQAEIRPAEPRRGETVRHSSGNPMLPTRAEAMCQVLPPEEAARDEAYLRPRVEGGQIGDRSTTADV